ncbi:MAG: DNA repair protein RadC [Saprospiraceae bacterium]
MPDKRPSIKDWSAEDQPREKLLSLGPAALSDTELLGILISTGSGYESALDLARKLLAANHQNLAELATMKIDQMTLLKGIGPAKAVTVHAAIELGRRINVSDVFKRKKISSWEDSIRLFDHLRLVDQEEFWVACLNVKSEILESCCVHKGGINQVSVDARIIFGKALEKKASSIIVAHNHPSGRSDPSREDEAMTSRLKEIGDLMGIKVNDHIIISKDDYYSFAKEGRI